MGSRLRVGRYRLVERLGGGQVAEVWRARGPRGRAVVIKRLLPHLAQAGQQADEARRLFARECRLQAGLAHPNFVRTLAVEETADGPLLVMEDVAGPTLQAILRWRQPGAAPPVGLVAHVAAEVCNALAYLHAGDERGGRPPLVHRDVTPSNVLVGRDGAVKLIDLGIALPLGDPDYTRTQTGVVKGKLEFVAPERRAGAAGGPEADLFSVGVILHLLLAGELPRPGAGLPATELSELCRGAQAERPAERPTARELAAALRAVADGRGYGTRQLAAEVEARFAAEVSMSATRTLPGGAAAGGGRRAWVGAVAAGVLAVVIGVGVLVHRRARAVAAPAPAVAHGATATAQGAADPSPRPPGVGNGAAPSPASLATSAAPSPASLANPAAPSPASLATSAAPSPASRTNPDAAPASGAASRAAAPPPHRRVRHPATKTAPAADETLLGKSLVDPFNQH